jgi:hypothetical protein
MMPKMLRPSAKIKNLQLLLWSHRSLMNMLKINDVDNNNKYRIFIITIIISRLFYEVDRYYNSTDLVKFLYL